MRLNEFHSKSNRRSPRRAVRQEQNGVSFSYLNIPFYSDTINNKIRKAFHREGVKVNLSHKTASLSSALHQKQTNTRSCNKKNCTLNDDRCFKKNIVYKISSSKCSEVYICTTIRDLHQHLHEHFNNENSSIFKHMMTCGSTPQGMEVSIIDHERLKGYLRIREAFHIQKQKPQINSKEESTIDLILFKDYENLFHFT